jgi:hypothetical protein
LEAQVEVKVLALAVESVLARAREQVAVVAQAEVVVQVEALELAAEQAELQQQVQE